MNASTPFFRVRWLLKARARCVLHTRQNAILYALLCDASRGERAEGPTHLPEGLLLDAPEVGRDRVEAGEEFAFGATLIEADAGQASQRLHRISSGLARMGRTPQRKPVALGGNFDVVEMRDLVAGTSIAPGSPIQSLSRESISEEFGRIASFLGKPIALRFLSPLRLELPADTASEGHRYADGSNLIIGQLLRTVQKRLAAIGIRRPSDGTELLFDDGAISLVENRLNWLDLEYGQRDLRKSLGGALGRVTATLTDPAALAALVWGQYARIGRNLHFGFGRYRIEELGNDPSDCQRAVSLLDLALTPAGLENAAAEHGVDIEELLSAAEKLLLGTYSPTQPQRVALRKSNGGERILLIPSRRDRALQRLLLARLGPAMDRLFETSSFAWRRGLSREAAARRLERMFKDGWPFAVRADLDLYFDSIPQRLLRERLEAWIGEDRVVDAVMAFVRSGCGEEVGIATGSPLSPLVGNIFLDRFDEQIEEEGGCLVRYADDFLILTKTREDAERLHQRSRELAISLLLRLNENSSILDLREPFEFLGYEFRQEESWQYAGPTGPQRVRELGWRDADRTPTLQALPLPGEVLESGPSGTVVAGPGVESLDVVGDELEILVAGKGEKQRIPIAGIERLVVLGPASWTSDAPGKLLRSGVSVQLVSDGGWPLGELVSEFSDDPDAITAQCLAAADPDFALRLAKPLVRAKLTNFAALLESALPPDADRSTVSQLRGLARESASAQTLDSLRGHEGAGAAAWYRSLPRLLGPGFSFVRRVSPDADDPVNVLLNMGHTMMYRHAIAACRAAGLSPAVGFLHSPTERFAAFAADIQEPFRHLVERAVILATRRMKPGQFIRREEGRYPLVLDQNATKSFHVLIQRSWHGAVVGRGQTEARSWLGQMIATVRSLRRHLLNPANEWEPFEHS